MKVLREKTVRFLKKILKILGLAHLALFSAVFLCIAACSFINPPFHSLMVYRALIFNHHIRPVNYVPLRQVPWELRSMLITLEDGNFNKHFGIDPEAMQTAFFNNLRLHKRYFGASTIDQQLARTLFLYPKKTFVRKYLEILIALEMNVFMTKDRILELYLNSVEWGKGIFGVQTASYYYFNKGVNELDRDEMMRLVTILPSPVKYGPSNFTDLRSLRFRYSLLQALDATNRILSATNGSTNILDLIESSVIQTNLSELPEVPEISVDDAESIADDNR